MSSTRDVDANRFGRTYSFDRRQPVVANEQGDQVDSTRDLTRYRKTYSCMRGRVARRRLVR